MQSESVGLWILRLAWAGECMDFVQKLRRPAQALENGVGLLKMCFFVGTVSPGMPPSFPTPQAWEDWSLCDLCAFCSSRVAPAETVHGEGCVSPGTQQNGVLNSTNLNKVLFQNPASVSLGASG